MEREVRYCTTEDGVRIAYCVEGEGPPLLVTPFLVESFVLEHLSPGHESFMRRLQEHVRLIRYDGRNVGWSQRNVQAVDLTSRVRDMEAVLRAAAAGPVSVWGRGTGGPHAIALAARQPRLVERLVLYGTTARMRDDYSDDSLTALAQMARANWPMTARTLADFSGRQEFGEAALDNAKLYQQSTTGEEVALLTEGTIGMDATPYLAKVECKTLVVHPMNDASWSPESAQRMTAAIPGAVFVPVEGSFHHIAFGDPESVLSVILSFLGVSQRTEAKPRPTTLPDLLTVLFTDLVGHTGMMSRLGDEKGREVLREHERITREVLKAHVGTEVKTMGDGFMASFGSVTRAVECAVALQKAMEARNRGVGAQHTGEADDVRPSADPTRSEVNQESARAAPLQVRIGLNAGEPIEEEGDLFGATVILASRIAGKAEGGEILVADTVRGLCSGKSFLFADRGEFVAKGFEEPVRVYEVRWRE